MKEPHSMQEAKIKFFDIKQCGYYRHGKGTPEYGDVSDTLEKLAAWAKDGRELINTITYEPKPEDDIFNTYFCDHHRTFNGDTVLTLWNEAANDEGAIYGMKPKDKPGSRAMMKTGFEDKEAIPGFPSYFWFIPQIGKFASIKFNHSAQGKRNLDHYLNGFLANMSPYRVIDEDGDIIGYSADGKKLDVEHAIYPRFNSINTKNDQIESELLANSSKITRMIKKETLDFTIPDTRKRFEKLFSGLLENAPKDKIERDITHNFQFKPTNAQLKEIIKNFNSDEKNHLLKDVGFVVRGKHIMLSGMSVAFPMDLDIQRTEDQMITPDKLLASLQKKRKAILSSL